MKVTTLLFGLLMLVGTAQLGAKFAEHCDSSYTMSLSRRHHRDENQTLFGKSRVRNTRRQCSVFAQERCRGSLDYHGTLLFQAITHHESLDKIKSLVYARPEVVHAKDANGRTPLHWAAADGMVTVVEFLLEQDADIDAEDIRGNTPLHSAVGNTSNLLNRLNTITVLLDEGAALDKRNEAGLNVFDVSKKFDIQGHLHSLTRRRIELVETRKNRERKITKLSQKSLDRKHADEYRIYPDQSLLRF